jgi:hypothetical protein
MLPPSAIFDALVSSGGHPEAMATSLIQTNAASVATDPACIDKTGFEHCMKCAVPAVKSLITSLVQVKDEIWQNQQTMATDAGTTCNKDAPGNRPGGAAKCCSAKGMPSAYEAAGFGECTGTTFSPPDTVVPVTADLKYNQLQGYYYDAGAPSSMIGDCCSHTSACTHNDFQLTHSMNAAERLMSRLYADRKAKKQKVDSVSIEVSLEATKIVHFRTEVQKICMLSTDAAHDADSNTGVFGSDAIIWPTDKRGAQRDCASGQLRRMLDNEAARQAKLPGDRDSFTRAIEVLDKVISWLKTGIFRDSRDIAPPVPDIGTPVLSTRTTAAPSHDVRADGGVEGAHQNLDSHYTAMVSLLEGTAKSTANAHAKQALVKAIALMEGSEGDLATQVVALLTKVRGDMQASVDKVTEYITTSQNEADTQVAFLLAKIGNLKQGREMAMLRKAQLEDSVSGFTVDVATKTSELENEEGNWIITYQQRELNAEKCSSFMRYFDTETKTNTMELLILQKVRI